MTRHEQLIELRDQHGYREKTIATWSEDRIKTVLESRRRERRDDLHRGNVRAAAVDGQKHPVSKLERRIAAAYLAEAIEAGGDAIVNALLYVGWCLTDSEVRGLAAELVNTLRGDDDAEAAA